MRAYAQSALDHAPVAIEQVRDGVKVENQIDAIHDLKTRLLSLDPPARMDVLEAERMVRSTLDKEAARDWLQPYPFAEELLNQMAGQDGGKWLATIAGFHQMIEGPYERANFDLRQTPAANLVNLADQIISGLKLEGPAAKRARELVLAGALSYLPFDGAGQQDLEDGGRYCHPEITHALRKEPFVMQLQAWVCFMLLSGGHLEDLWAVLRFEQFWNADDSRGNPWQT